MNRKNLFLAFSFLALTTASVHAQNNSIQWWWSSGLGFYAANINDTLAKDLNLPRSKGLLVLAIARNSAADQAGLKPGDIIADWSPREIFVDAGKTGSIQIVRDGLSQTLSATSAKVNEDASLDLIRPQTQREPETFSVDADGGGDFRTLTAAVFRSQPGDGITLKPGLYTESVLLRAGVSIRTAEKSLARVETKTPWLLIGAGATELSSIVFAEVGLIVENGDKLTLTDCEFQVQEKKTGFILTNSREITVTRSTFRGTEGTTGISAQGSQVAVSESIFMGHGNAAVVLAQDTRGEMRKNLMDDNASGVLVYNSTLTAFNNVMGGSWSPEKSDKSASFGFRLDHARGDLQKNVVRRHRYGIMATGAPDTVKISEGTVTQTEFGIVVIGSPAVVSANLIMQNLSTGVYVGIREKEPQTSPQQVSIIGNTLSGNQRNAIEIDRFKHVTVNDNLIENNGSGVDLGQSSGSIENNTFVLQRFSAVNVRAGSDAEIFNNIVAFNSFGLFIDVAGKHKAGHNNIFGNLASTEFPLRDGNYGRADRYVTRDGRKVRLDIYPAYDLRSETDLSYDPGFVKLGSDYNLLSSSALASARGKGGRYIGAFAPATFVSSPSPGNETVNASAAELKRRPRTVGAAKAGNRAVGPLKTRSPKLTAVSSEAASLVARGDDLMKSSRWQEALSAYQQATELAPSYAQAFNALGWAYIDMGRFGEAFPPLVKAIQLNPQLAEAHYGIAAAYLGSDNYAKAIGFLKTAVRLNPNEAHARFSLGETCLALGNKRCAEEQHAALKSLDDKLARELYLELEETPY